MKHCDPGQYCYKTTYHPHATCEDCGAGTVSTGGKCHEYWGCSVCPAGKQMPTAGGTLCSDCPGGTYSDSGASSCNACEKGKSSVKGATSAETCYWCPAGRYSNQPGTAACEACPEGKYLEQTGQTSAQTCSACPGGAWSPAGSGDAVFCQNAPPPLTVDKQAVDEQSGGFVFVVIGFMIVATVIIILKVSRWHRHKAAEREFGAVQVTEVTEVAQMNPMAMQPNAIVEAHAVQVPSAAAAVESERPFVSPESPPVLSGEKDQPDLGL